MRHEKAATVLELARQLSSSAEGLTLDEMARAAGCGRRTAERMRDALEQLFPQMDVLSEGTVKRFRIRGGLDGFFQSPTTEELLELSKSAATLRAQGHTAGAAALETLERKVRSAIKGATLRKLNPDVEVLARAELTAVRAGPRPHEDRHTLGLIRQAIMSLSAVRFRYAGGSRPNQYREVAPYGILLERMNYLVGPELGSEDPRSWRLDRITDIELLETTAFAPPSFDMAEYAGRSFGVYQDAPQAVRLRISPAGAAEARVWRFHSNQILTEEPDGSVIIAFTSGGMRELAWHLVTWGDQVEILAPPLLQTTMVEQLQTCLRRHALPNATEVVLAPA